MSKNPAAVALGKLGGKSGTGAAKKRTTSFTAASSQKALAARWAKAKRNPKRVVRRSNAPGERPLADSDARRSQ